MEFEENNDDPWMHKAVMMNFKIPSIYFQFKRRENKNNVISMQVLQVEKQNKNPIMCYRHKGPCTPKKALKEPGMFIEH